MSEYHVKRRMPWSISPRFANGLTMYSLLAFQVLVGLGNSFAQVALKRYQSAMTIAKPRSGRISQSSLSLFIFDQQPTQKSAWTSESSSFEVVHLETLRVVLRFGRVESFAVEESLGRVITAAVRVADLLHSFFIKVRA